MRRTIYISGRVSGTSDAKERFRRVEQRLRLAGMARYQPCPQDRTHEPCGNALDGVHARLHQAPDPLRCHIPHAWLASVQGRDG